VIASVVRAELAVVPAVEASDRGAGGFGHTGVQ
jgi:dUTPase